MKFLSVVVLLGFSFHFSCAEGLNIIHKNNSGVSALEKDHAFEAEKIFLEALAEDPFNPVIRFNYANALLSEKKYEAAAKEYNALLREPNLPKALQFSAHFN